MNCQSLASDIFYLAELLTSNNLIQDAKSLYDASSKLQSSQNTSNWDYECGNLKFTAVGTVAGSIPQQISLVDITLSIEIGGVFSKNENECNNPLSKLTFDIELEGWKESCDKIDNFFACWHLDKNIKSTQTTYIHPEYHLTFGGNKLEEKGVDCFGAMLILSSPRIKYPPMDVILGIDFIIQNYLPYNEISGLLEDPKYQEIIYNSQLRLWRPYYLSLSSIWNKIAGMSFESGFEYYKLNPHIKEFKD